MSPLPTSSTTRLPQKKVLETAAKDVWEHAMYQEEIDRVQETLKDLFLMGDVDMTGDIGLPEFEKIMEHKTMQDVLEAFDVSLEVDCAHLFEIVDADCNGSLTFEDWFFWALDGRSPN